MTEILTELLARAHTGPVELQRVAYATGITLRSLERRLRVIQCEGVG